MTDDIGMTMGQTSEQLAALDQMRTEGRISQEEYEDLRVGILGPDEDTSAADDPDESTSAADDPRTVEVAIPRLRSDRSLAFVAGIVLTSVVLLVIAVVGVLPWFASILAVTALVATLFEKGTWVSGAAVVGLGVILVISLTGASNTPDAETSPVLATTPQALEPVPGSLGLYVDDLADLWNTVSEPPEIRGAFTRYSESGDYDSFLYRFGDWGRFAGAYDRENDAVYALAAAGQFHEAAVAHLYLHLCYVVEPFSQECIDSYFEKGLEGGVLDDYIDGSHSASWQLGDNRWSVEIAGNVLTIRVLSPDVS